MTPVGIHNGKKVVRHTSRKPTPFLSSLEGRLDTFAKMCEIQGLPARAADIGCGAGRNSQWLLSKSWDVVSFDLKPDYGIGIDLERQAIPVFDGTCNLVLMQFVLMFLDRQTISRTFEKAITMCSELGMIVVELADVKNGLYHGKELTELLDFFEVAVQACRFTGTSRSGLKLACWRF